MLSQCIGSRLGESQNGSSSTTDRVQQRIGYKYHNQTCVVETLKVWMLFTVFSGHNDESALANDEMIEFDKLNGPSVTEIGDVTFRNYYFTFISLLYSRYIIKHYHYSLL